MNCPKTLRKKPMTHYFLLSFFFILNIFFAVYMFSTGFWIVGILNTVSAAYTLTVLSDSLHR